MAIFIYVPPVISFTRAIEFTVRRASRTTTRRAISRATFAIIETVAPSLKQGQKKKKNETKKEKKKQLYRVSCIDPKSITVPLEYYSPNYRLEDPRPRAIRGLLHKASKQASGASGRADGLNAIIGPIRI